MNTRNRALGAAAAVLFGHVAARAIAANAVRRVHGPDGNPGAEPEDVKRHEVIQGQAGKASPGVPFGGGPRVHPAPTTPTRDFTLCLAERNEIGEYGHASYIVNMSVPMEKFVSSSVNEYLAGTLKTIEKMRAESEKERSEEDDD